MLNLVDKNDVKYEGEEICENFDFELMCSKSHPHEYELMCSKRHPHEYYGVRYLLSIVYKQYEISLNGGEPAGYPDITTFRIIDDLNDDEKLWEVKIVNNNTIIFGFDQIFHMSRDANVLIFRKDQEEIEPIDIIKFEDIISGKYDKYEISVVANIDIITAKFFVDCLKSKKTLESIRKLIEKQNKEI